MPTILLLRHGQASFGSDDYDVLSETGVAQVPVAAAAVAARGARPTRVLAGTMRRQLDTAKPWDDLGIERDPRWNEYDTSDLMGAHSESGASLENTTLDTRAFQAVLDEGMAAWIAAGDDSSAAEPFPAFRARVASALEDLAGSLGRGETALVSTSGGVIAAAALIGLGLPDALLPNFNRVLVNASITKLVSGRSGLTLLSFNDHAHVEAAGLVTNR